MIDKRINDKSMPTKVGRAYSTRASEYVSKLGSLEDMDSLDVTLITEWGAGVAGPLLDAGCGPGHWTELLHKVGCNVRGIDIVPEFIDSARQRFPGTSFEVGDLLNLPFEASRFEGILAWYSLIHMRPEELTQALKEFSRVLRPEGVLLIGGFLGSQDTPFDHAITQAFYWSAEGLADRLESSGFQVTSTQTRFPQDKRPHLSMVARRIGQVNGCH